MADNNQAPEQDDVPPMPPSSDDTNGMRVKSVKKSNKMILVGFGVVVLIMGYVMFVPRGGDQPAPRSNNATDPTFIDGGATIGGDGASEQMRDPSTQDGGVGRERAEVLSEIQEREEILEKIERGETAVIFGDPVMVEEEEPEPAPPAPVFGNIKPREPEPTSVSTSQGNAPLTNTPPAIRPRPSGQQNASTGTMIDSQALQYELDQMGAGGGANTTVHYTSYQPSASNRQDRHTLTPQLDADKEGEAVTTLKSGELAMPGDMTVAYLNNRISSDQPDSMAQADILSGELRGARLLGQGEFQGQRLLVRFTQMVYEGEIYPINALAVDPQTMESSVADGVNRRLFTRYGVPILMGVASIGIDYQAERANPSVTEIDQQTGERITRRSNDAESFGDYAIGESGDSLRRPLSDIAQNAANVQPHVWANPGAVGILFTQPVPE